MAIFVRVFSIAKEYLQQDNVGLDFLDYFVASHLLSKVLTQCQRL